jgi:methionyl-tRNA synthetase
MGGEKISKSRSVMPPRPEPVLKKLMADTGCSQARAVDALRYYELREMTFGQDSDFSQDGLLRRYSDDLGNDLGNLLHRVLSMLGRYRQGVLPAPCAPESELAEAAQAAATTLAQAFDALDFSGGLRGVWEFLGVINRYVDHQAPWALAKNNDAAGLDRVLYASAEALRIAAVLVAPVMPTTADDIECQLGLKDWKRTWEQATQWGLLPGGQAIGEATPLFPKLDPGKAKPVAAPKPAPAAPPKEKTVVSFKDFQNLELRVAQVLTAEPVPGATKLLKLSIDLGDEQRTLVAGIALAYQPADLIGKKIVVIANLEPAVIRGVRSEGMLLAGSIAGDDSTIALVTPERDLPPGARVK